MKKVCVLLAAYNGSDYIEEQIQSILSQKMVNIDLYIRLDPSSDNTQNIIRKLMLKHSNLYLLTADTPSGSAGQNFFNLIRLVDTKEYDFVAFADQDDIWDVSKLNKAIELMSLSNSDGYSSNVTAFWEDGRQALIKKSSPQAEYDFLFESPGPGCTFVFSNKLFKSIKKNIEDNHDKLELLWLHDWYCYSFARTNDYKWVIDPRPLMQYRQHLNNEVGANFGFSSFFNRLKVMFNGSGLKYTLDQAKFIGQDNIPPIQYLHQGRLGCLKLFLISYKLRRRLLHKIFCGGYFLILAIIGNDLNKDGYS